MTVRVSFDWSAGIATETEEMRVGQNQQFDLSRFKDWDESILVQSLVKNVLLERH